MAQASAAANRILSLRSTAKSTDPRRSTVFEDGAGSARIEFKEVHFKYPTRDLPVFAGLNLSVGGTKAYAEVGGLLTWKLGGKGAICCSGWSFRYGTSFVSWILCIYFAQALLIKTL